MVQLLDLAEAGSGVRIFIGSENKLFSLSGSSLVVAPIATASKGLLVLWESLGPHGSTMRGSFPWWTTPLRSFPGSCGNCEICRDKPSP